MIADLLRKHFLQKPPKLQVHAADRFQILVGREQAWSRLNRAISSKFIPNLSFSARVPSPR